MPFLTIMPAEELREKKENFSHYKELLHSLGSIRYCKAEVYRNCILGTLCIPQKSKQRGPQISCGFYLTEEEAQAAKMAHFNQSTITFHALTI